MERKTETFTLAGREFVGRLGPKDVGAMESALGCGVSQFTKMLGFNFASLGILLAVKRCNKEVKDKEVESKLEEEMEENGLDELCNIVVQMLQNVGALGSDKSEKKEVPPAS